ncbi:MAG: glutamate 5-kinase [Paracoccaceae bacterium]
MAALTQAKRLVVKIGSSLLVGPEGLRLDWLKGLAADVAEIRAAGTDVILVSSGSIALGRVALDMSGELALEQSQAAAAVGQIRLAGAYEDALAPFGIITAQVLLTLEDSTDRRRYLNSRATMEQLLTLGVVPIVNENDTIATDEIRFGDNDRLAAQIAVTIGADELVLLSDVDGFYSGDPRTDAGAIRYDVIDAITPEIEAMAGDAGSGLSKGGMKTKLMAARTAMQAGCTLVVTEGSRIRPLRALAEGAAATRFVAQGDPQTARKRWIAAMKSKGVFSIDAGAAGALAKGKSLLPAGVVQVRGEFGRGEPVVIHGPGGEVLGQGLTRYSNAEAARIAGQRSGAIEGILGYPARAALIHRDDMAL